MIKYLACIIIHDEHFSSCLIVKIINDEHLIWSEPENLFWEELKTAAANYSG
jgi:hypothetical protein